MGFLLGPSGHARRSNGAAWKWILATGIVLGGVAVGWLASRGFLGSGPSGGVEPEIDSRPVILALRKIGQLHTAEMTMKDVLRKTSDRPAEGWVREVPGSDFVAKWATHNEVLIVAQGTVEAGVDLSSISQKDITPDRRSDGQPRLRVHLPSPVIYPPTVTVTVENSQSGLLWKDENLIPKAEEEARKRFLDAAEKDHIQEHAKDHALQTLQQMQQALGQKNVEFYF